MKRALWLVVFAACSAGKMLLEWACEYAQKQIKGETPKEGEPET